MKNQVIHYNYQSNKKIFMKQLKGFLLCIVFSFLTLTGCGKEKSVESVSNSEEKDMIWQGHRENNFGVYKDNQLSSEKAAEKLLNEKFDVFLPLFFKQSEMIINQSTFLSSLKKKETTYAVEANQEILRYQQVTYYGTEKQEKVARSMLEITYIMDMSKKETRAMSQQVTITTIPSEVTEFYKTLPELTEKMSKELALSYSEDEYKSLFKELMEEDPQRRAESKTILSSVEENEILERKIQVYYDTNGYLTEWHTEVNEK